jgi:hypothetical protein
MGSGHLSRAGEGKVRNMSEITIVDRTAVKEIGDRIELEWKLSAKPALEWAEIFQMAELAVMPSQVVDSTDGGLPPESGVAAVMIVEMQE